MKLRWLNKDIAKIYINDKTLHPFIFHTGSLTRYIRQQCHGKFNIAIKSESWQYPMQDEVQLIKTRQSEKVFIRESWLKCDDKALIYARTIIPRKTLTGKNKKLTELGNKPLGEILFSGKTSYRASMRYAEITKTCSLYNQVISNDEINSRLWARQSLFYIRKKPLLIIEVFLPEITTCIRN